jgi:hypothetical protein
LERRLRLPEWQVVKGKSGSYRTGGEANDNNTKKECTRKTRNKIGLVLLCFYYFSNQPRYNLPQQTSTRALLFLVSVSFCPPPSTKRRKKSGFMSILVNDWFSGSRLRGENGEQTSLSNQVMVQSIYYVGILAVNIA